jgi:hypothetical protein
MVGSNARVLHHNPTEKNIEPLERVTHTNTHFLHGWKKSTAGRQTIKKQVKTIIEIRVKKLYCIFFL